MKLLKMNVYKMTFKGSSDIGHPITVIANNFDEAKEIALQERDNHDSIHTLVKMELIEEGAIIKER